MSEPRRRSLGIRVVKFLLGNDEPAFVTAAAGAILALGIITFFHIVYFSPPPYPPLWRDDRRRNSNGPIFDAFFLYGDFPDNSVHVALGSPRPDDSRGPLPSPYVASESTGSHSIPIRWNLCRLCSRSDACCKTDSDTPASVITVIDDTAQRCVGRGSAASIALRLRSCRMLAPLLGRVLIKPARCELLRRMTLRSDSE